MYIAMFMNETVPHRGATIHFLSFAEQLKKSGHEVCLFSLESTSRRQVITAINNSDADVVVVMHFESVWIMPFLDKPIVYYLLEPPRAFYEQWLWDNLSTWKKMLVWLRGQVDRCVVRRYMSYGVANSAYSADIGFRVYGKQFLAVYPGVDPLRFYPGE